MKTVYIILEFTDLGVYTYTFANKKDRDLKAKDLKKKLAEGEYLDIFETILT